MAGMGKRMRPHTLTIPKPLIKISGKSIVQLLIEEISKSIDGKIDEIAFVIGDFGKKIENELQDIAKNLGAKPSIYYQLDPLGTAHAIYCAKESLKGETIVAFADTLFKGNISLNKSYDSIIWVKEVEDPSQFGVVKLGEKGQIVEFVEKPSNLISNLAIIGIYFFKKGEELKEGIQHIIENKIVASGEYQLTTVLENMVKDGKLMFPGKVDSWLDCGNKDATLNTNKEILKHSSPGKPGNIELINSIIIDPCYIGNNVKIENSIIGPYVSLGNDSMVCKSTIRNSIIQENSYIDSKCLSNSMIGNHCHVIGKTDDLNIGDYSKIGSE